MQDCPIKRGDRLALHSSEESLTYTELDRRIEALRLSLPSTPLCIFDASQGIIPHLFAAWRNGQSVALLNPRLPPLAREAFIERLPKSAPPTELLLFTSGSSGTPKLACLSLASLYKSALSALPILEIDSSSRTLLRLPLHHVGGIGALLRTFLAGGTLSLDERDLAITHLSLVPTHLARSTPRYPHLRAVLLGGAPILSYPNHLPIFATYGLTEMGSLVVAKKSPPFDGEGRLFLGPPLPGREIKVDPEGELYVKGETLFQGYWEEGKLHLPIDKEGWFHTGDLAYFCPKKGLAILGRRDGQFISGGENIQPEEIERHLFQETGIEEAIVVGKEDPIFGAKPIAFLKGDPRSIDLIALRNLLAERLPKYKIPVEFHFVDAFPEVGGKIDRAGLKKIF